MKIVSRLRWLAGALAVGGLLLLATDRADAQTSTGTIRGFLKDANGVPLAAGEVQAKNIDNGVSRTVTTNSDGSYTLAGLTPAVYDLTARHIGNSPQARRVVVQIGATLLADFTLPAGAVELATVNVQAVAPTSEIKTSEVATNVTLQQIQALPTPSRNFLDLAALAPGVIASPDFVNLGANTVTARTITAGAQGPGAVNVFIDGSSLKNDLTGNGSSGIAGQDASRGNPFPRNAIQEYRVITQNFKAEYQNASSAIITATTKSGGNTWSGDAFVTYENKSFVALDSISLANHVTKPDYNRSLLGLSVGGPLIRDRSHIFVSYEGNYQNRSNLVNIKPPTAGAFPALDTVSFNGANGSFASPFRETLLFGKVDYVLSNNSAAELSVTNRHETDQRDFGGLTAFASAIDYRQNSTIANLKHSYFSGPWLNEAQLTFERFQRNPTQNSPGIPHRSFRSFGTFSGADLGSNLSSQDFKQNRIGVRNDLTYTGFHGGGDHVFKTGVHVDFLKYDINKANNATPVFLYGDSISPGDANCAPSCTGNEAYAYRVPFQMQWAAGNPVINTNNTQIGAYLQDDWSPTPRLTLNLGVRWDFESHMFNYNFVTPQDVRDSIVKYNNTLQSPIDEAEYFTNGSQRHKFYGAWQPRLGFSYALDQSNKTTLFGGVGVFYDRTFFDLSVDEMLKLTRPLYTVFFANPDSTPTAGQLAWNDRYLTANPAVLDSLVTSGTAAGREVWLIGNNTKAPHSTQWNLGIRRLFGDVLVSAAYVGVRGYDGLVFNWANFSWIGFGTDTSRCCAGSAFGHGFTNILFTTNSAKTWYDAVQFQVNRPYRKAGNFGWGAGLSFTSGQRSLAGIDNPDDQFAFPQSRFILKHPSNDEKSRVVANWVMDLPFAYGIQFSGLMTLGSGPRYDVSGRFDPKNFRPGGFAPPQYAFIIPGAWAYRDVDVKFRKDFPEISGTTLGVTAEVLNVFNFQNFTYFAGNPTPTGLLSDGRRLQIGAEYHF
jgi:outer membrane receptor protein involved in Fe transport